ncbi:flavin monoamine oxidase family protein [Streptomyces sp. NPDC057494]|uniref:flavin monoamine oxidase family protein n=1 Tax=Streptomyces sp. NPDC057494 TaxID=3346148 RepID=UPI003682EFFD
MTDGSNAAASTDVVVVGAGLSGLTAAHRLVRLGHSVVVLEAGDRVGGRTVNLDVAEGVVADGGAQWIGGLHTRVSGLVEELGLSTFDTYMDGRTLYVREGRRKAFEGTVPPLRPLAIADFAQAQYRLERMARTVPAATPWTARKAAAWDGTTLGHWLDANVRLRESRHLLTLCFTLMLCEDPHRTSLLKVLHSIRTSGGIDFMVNTRKGAQETRIDGGTHQLSAVLAERLGDRVVLGSPVTAIRQDHTGVLVRSARRDVRCRRVIVAMPPADAARISFSPGLPTRRAALQRVWHNGTESKVFAVYDKPFWRERGLNGSAFTDLPVAHYVVDSSPADGSLGILLAFVGTAGSGPGLTWTDAVLDDTEARQEALLKDLAALFGPEAARPLRVVEQSWVDEPWIAGCVSTRAPGVMTRYTDAVTAPVGRIHWAGTEAAPEFEGYLEGAVRAADRAVEEVRTALRTAAPQAPDLTVA